MDTYQGSLHHSSILAQSQFLEGDDIDQKSSWVMIRHDGAIEPLPKEQILLATPPRVSLELTVPRALRNESNSSFAVKNDDGTAYVTNQRVIYLPAKPTDEFKSFHAPILNINDTHPTTAWHGFGAWSWEGVVTPVTGGGIPPEVVRAELKLTFRDGGMDNFDRKFKTIKERLEHAVELARETGQPISVHDETLPAYAPPSSTATQAPPSATGAPAEGGSAQSQSQQTPDEPPPDYDEAQAQAVGERFEVRIREEVERDG